ncbi:diacylglycerol kinase [Defluviimonas sp. WL0075]|uniref:Diacylglycerol kinase n=1 Tax=Albidovulum sediminicola TaxID=2984331 RepID=A0ABT2Z0D3_9RHOB|nr:diacylglycerol kinase [Defluviimonas sp. WL0075]MCV2864598.1 diacylglycerol kinase [Defluviimonas sp. WL0075]
MGTPEKEAPRTVIPPRGGLMHVVDAAGYSLAGLRRLWAETAARLEIAGAVAVILAFLWRGVEPWHWLVAGALAGLVLATEAINTAIEVLTDRISPEWSQTAKDAKDLGSLAVGLMLLVFGGFFTLVMTRLI